MKYLTVVLLFSAALGMVFISLRAARLAELAPAESHWTPEKVRTVTRPLTATEQIIAGAQTQLRDGALYTPGYFRIAYPNGDLPRDKGVCADVVIRALRSAGCDLQKLIHEDMEKNFALYPQRWHLTQPDPNIDHRRVLNQMVFFQRSGALLPVTLNTLSIWQPGDIVYWKLPNGLEHCGVLSDRRNAAGLPLVIHNLDQCAEEDCLARWRIIAHARYPLEK